MSQFAIPSHQTSAPTLYRSPRPPDAPQHLLEPTQSPGTKLRSAAMARIACHVVYVTQAQHSRVIRLPLKPAWTVANDLTSLEPEYLARDLVPLLHAFEQVYLCHSRSACLAQISRLLDLTPTPLDSWPIIVLIEISPNDRLSRPSSSRFRSPSPLPSGNAVSPIKIEDVRGLDLLQGIVSECKLKGLSTLVVPIGVISAREEFDVVGCDGASSNALFAPFELAPISSPVGSHAGVRSQDPLSNHGHLVRSCLDLGALDVITSPITVMCVATLEIHACHAYRDAIAEQSLFLNEKDTTNRFGGDANESMPSACMAMVVGLMEQICKRGNFADRTVNARVHISSDRRAAISSAIGQWSFCAHNFSDDELVIAAEMIFKHALETPGLEIWHLSSDQLAAFLSTCRNAYNNFCPFHNFRHVVDVLQATFHFLLHLGVLPQYKYSPALAVPADNKSPLSSLILPLDALNLLITAIGHDVGHPGVTNKFLVALKSPLAQLYNDRSVLESFHCATFSQILRSHWPAAHNDTNMRKLLISSTLSTDMSLHFDFMKRLQSLQAELEQHNTTDGWSGSFLEEQKSLACSLLIKSADISNVARVHEVSLKWMLALSDEFNRQSKMEGELNIQTDLIAIPKDDIYAHYKSQVGFMDMFAKPLFQALASLMPALRYAFDELERNKVMFDHKMSNNKRPPFQMRQLDEAALPPMMQSRLAATSPREASNNRTEKPRGSNKSTFRNRNGTALNHSAQDTHINYSKAVAGTATKLHGDSFAVKDSSRRPRRQRGSETTDDGGYGPQSNDTASPSVTTGTAPISLSTQKTSVASLQSAGCCSGASAALIPSPFSDRKMARELRGPRGRDPACVVSDGEDEDLNGSFAATRLGSSKLQKRPSPFRMNGLSFFRRHKSSSPPLAAMDRG